MLNDNKVKDVVMSKNQIKDLFGEILRHESENDEIEFEAVKIHLATMMLIEDIMKEDKMKRVELAKKLKVTKSVVSKYFTASKMLNMKTLAKLQKSLNVKITINVERLDTTT